MSGQNWVFADPWPELSGARQLVRASGEARHGRIVLTISVPAHSLAGARGFFDFGENEVLS